MITNNSTILVIIGGSGVGGGGFLFKVEKLVINVDK